MQQEIKSAERNETKGNESSWNRYEKIDTNPNHKDNRRHRSTLKPLSPKSCIDDIVQHTGREIARQYIKERIDRYTRHANSAVSRDC